MGCVFQLGGIVVSMVTEGRLSKLLALVQMKGEEIQSPPKMEGDYSSTEVA